MKHIELPFNCALSIGLMKNTLNSTINNKIHFGIVSPPKKYRIKGISLVFFRFIIGVHTRIK